MANNESGNPPEIPFTLDCRFVRFQSNTVGTTDGLLVGPETQGREDVFLMVHGLTMNFYSPLYLGLAKRFSHAGHTSLLFNTRGHDLFSTSDDFDRKSGAMWETIADCVEDIEGGIRFLLELGHRRVVLLGHSLGGLKVLYHSAHVQNQVVRSIVLCSPVRSMRAIYKFRLGERFEEIQERATECIRRGDPDRLLSLYPVWPYVLSAKSVVDFMSSDTRANVYKFIDKISVPLLVVLDGSEREYSLATDAKSAPRCDTVRVRNADHFFNGVQTQTADAILGWLRSWRMT
jgi:pimeloyl-ACP methyl ester carboxylesterase